MFSGTEYFFPEAVLHGKKCFIVVLISIVLLLNDRHLWLFVQRPCLSVQILKNEQECSRIRDSLQDVGVHRCSQISSLVPSAERDGPKQMNFETALFGHQ